MAQATTVILCRVVDIIKLCIKLNRGEKTTNKTILTRNGIPSLKSCRSVFISADSLIPYVTL